MAAIGSMVFCTDCGNLLPATKGTEKNILQCECCGVWNRDTGSKTILTKSKPSDFPSFLRQKLQSKVQAVERHNIQTKTAAQERCRNCGREEVTYTTLQLRSADEGSTVIYSCQCGNSYVCAVQFIAVTLANVSCRWNENN
ncbi:DNA-directed RNA polymerase subunit [Tolypocladium paradoxum]|uniref:DNA-directed RNA polymerase subunit n=1 Tax=Tolypocladium paradoxum TaxID=94208 RepID=A0A2S4L1E3_9HYPO|nr:DNA-directed RNA polymerase subunit [Tolypocladium paradoxum]